MEYISAVVSWWNMLACTLVGQEGRALYQLAGLILLHYKIFTHSISCALVLALFATYLALINYATRME